MNKTAMISGAILAMSLPLFAGSANQSDMRARKNSSTSDMPRPTYDDSFFLEGDFIYWYVRQEGNTYASTGNYFSTPKSFTNVTSGSVFAPNPKVVPGFKVAAGMNFEYDFWDLVARYTWFITNQSSQAAVSNPYYGLLPLFIYDGGGFGALSEASFNGGSSYVSKATANWHLLFNAIDAELGKNFYLTQAYYLRTFWGLKGAWQNSRFGAKYLVSNGNSNRIKADQFVWFLGPRVGVEGTWNLLPPYTLLSDSAFAVGFFANTALSALWSQFQVTAKAYDTDSTNGYSSLLIANQKYNPAKLTPVIEMTIGIESNWVFDNFSCINFQAAWENQVWLYVNQHSSSISDISLSLSGLTLKARYNY